ncbi:HlyD family efflux transporter periplasmic adaptor subunit [Phyllobacterium sp. YR531]|uniref:efflux RND transporter periplasmic adaptor subunit n=1 Tax=Phyllobacterium sp. YR531 TaxID=1144343 RepID=UPI00026F98AA|nr:HlyD family efflux transporter periplasmic adaptor subunit [Phyllobacterium sp. YR531]EJN03640.1 membrane-fusion protein [Phyllobacterium sp. YR531]
MVEKAPLQEPVQLQPVSPVKLEQRNQQAFDLLLKIEADTRQAETVGELTFLIANETPKLSRARQVFVFTRKGKPQRVAAVSAMGKVERDSPRIRWIESVVAALEADIGLHEIREFTLPAYCPPDDEEHKNFPYRFLAWFPLKLRDGYVFGGMLLAREVPWNQTDLVVVTRLAETYSHSWSALTGTRKLKRRLRLKPFLLAGVAIAVIAGFIPVPLTVLAPTEIVPVEPRIVAAPIDGVIEAIEVDPNANVAAGQLLLRMSDTALRNELSVAEQEVNVAQAKLKQVTQGAIADPKLRGDLAIAGTELSLATAKRNYASDLLARTQVTSPEAGVVMYTDKRDLIGRPVSTGERLMEVANPQRTQIRIDVPVADAIAVKAGAPVRAFLDSDPLQPIRATVRAASFEAQMIEGDVLAYRVYATLEDAPEAMRLGIRGTAQISGDKVPLAYYLFRRPIATIRQRLGI